MPKLTGGYWIAANRDEALARPEAVAPQIHQWDGCRVAAPIDPVGGGTWIAVNENGLSVTLLNGYGEVQRPEREDWLSRGQVVKALSSTGDLGDLCQRVREYLMPRLPDLRGFKLLAVVGHDSEPEALMGCWNGEQWSLEPVTLPFAESSSSFDGDAARRERLRQVEDYLSQARPADPEQARQLFASHRPRRGPYSICVHRDDAATVSHTFIDTDAQRIVLKYVDGAPCDRETQMSCLSLAATTA